MPRGRQLTPSPGQATVPTMRILVIGGAGYIGSHVALELRDAGHDVVVFDNLRSGLRRNLLPGTTFVHGDIRHADQLRDAMDGIDAVIHLAALKAAGASMVVPQRYAEANITGTIAILGAMVERGVRRIVFSSSAAVYGEPQYLPIDEAHPTNPENFYGFTKLEVERILQWYDTLHGVRAANLRYFNAAGYDAAGRIGGLEQNPANLLPVIMEVATGQRRTLSIFGDDYPTHDGTGVRDYIHVTDLAVAHRLALEAIDTRDHSLTVNLGSETGLSVLDMLEAARRISGREIPAERVARRPGDPARLVASSGRAAELLGWRARSSDLETLVATTWRAYREA